MRQSSTLVFLNDKQKFHEQGYCEISFITFTSSGFATIADVRKNQTVRLPDPDAKRLQALYEEFYRLRAEGRFAKPDFDRLWPQFVEAADGEGDALEVLFIHVDPEWIAEKPRQ